MTRSIASPLTAPSSRSIANLAPPPSPARREIVHRSKGRNILSHMIRMWTRLTPNELKKHDKRISSCRAEIRHTFTGASPGWQVQVAVLGGAKVAPRGPTFGVMPKPSFIVVSHRTEHMNPG